MFNAVHARYFSDSFQWSRAGAETADCSTPAAWSADAGNVVRRMKYDVQNPYPEKMVKKRFFFKKKFDFLEKCGKIGIERDE